MSHKTVAEAAAVCESSGGVAMLQSDAQR